MPIDGQVALVTGAALLDLGEDGPARAAKRIDGPVATIAADVTDRAAVFGAVERAEAELGGFDIMVDNAGIAQVQAISEITEAEIGAGTATDPTADDPVAAVRAATSGGAHVAFEVTGVPSVLSQAMESTRHEGQTLIVSIWEADGAFQPNTVVLRARQIQGSIGYGNVYPAVLDLMSKGYFPADKLVTKRTTIDRIVEDGFELLAAEKSQIKILVEAPG